MEDWFRAISDLGFAIVVAVAAGLISFWLLRALISRLDADIADARRERDEARDISRAQTVATDKLVDRLNQVEQRLVDELTRQRRGS